MNRNHFKALLLSAVACGVAANAAAQKNPLVFPPPTTTNQDWIAFCFDPKDTTSPYSTDYGIEYQYDALFGAVMGASGTARFDFCWPTHTTVNMPGRLGFFEGADQNAALPNGGSTQDNLAGTPIDDALGLTYGTYTGVGGNAAVAKLRVGTPTTAAKGANFFGQGGLDTFYWGASDRYFIGECTESNFRMQLRVDVIGDAARCQWTLTNTQATAATVGLWFGQWVYMFGPQGTHSADFVTAPGLKPLSTDTRFVRNANSAATNPAELEMPPYMNFGMYQSWAYGLQVVLQPNAQIPDQTLCDGIDIGKNSFLLGPSGGNGGEMPDSLLPDTFFDDLHYETFGGDLGASTAYVQKWDATPVGPAGGGADTRVIVAYYRTTWGTSDYAKPYSVVLDGPQVISTTPGQPNAFQNAPFFVTVDIDDTRGFTTNDQSIALQDVEVDLDLPPGMTDANNPLSNHMVQYLNSVQPQTVGKVTFKVAVDPTVFGQQQYTVTVKPNPGLQKTIQGTVVVASQPYLQLTGTANLVTAPWQFGSTDWATIIGANSNLVLDQDFQVFGWDAQAQSYVLQTGPQRGFGSFIVSNQNVGYVPLGGSPQQAPDLQSGSPNIIIQPGWNLIANPYNYAISLGQLVGVPTSDNQNSYTFTELVNNNVVNGFLAYWDPQTQGYGYTTSYSDPIQPNTGYWIFVESSQPVVISFPPVFQPFIPNLVDAHNTPGKKKSQKLATAATPIWSLQLSARSNGVIDASTSIGQTTTPQLAAAFKRYKAPIAPVKNAVRSSIYVPNGKKPAFLSQALIPQTVTNQTWTWQVYTQNPGPVTLTWPNMNQIPSNVTIKLVDPQTGSSRLLRQTPSVTFNGGAQSTKTFNLVVTTGPALPVIQSLTGSVSKSSGTFAYSLSVNATTTVTVTQNNQVIATLVANRADKSGVSTATWSLVDDANRPVKNGTYQVVVSSTPSGGSTATKSLTVTVKR